MSYSQNNKEKTDLEVRKAVTEAYGNVLLAEESIAIFEKNKANLEKNLFETTKIFENKNEHITRVDISSGIVFFDVSLNSHMSREFSVKNFDRMIVIPVTKKGSFNLIDNLSTKTFIAKENSIKERDCK